MKVSDNWGQISQRTLTTIGATGTDLGHEGKCEDALEGNQVNGEWRLFHFPHLQYWAQLEPKWNVDVPEVAVIY